MNDKIINWLLKGDISIQYQVYRDLLDKKKPGLRSRIEKEGFGKRFLSKQLANGHWGKGFYQPKWISTHYTVLDLKYLAISPKNKNICQAIKLILQNEKGNDGGVNPSKTIPGSDVCVNGMVLNYASYFGMLRKDLKSIIDFILSEQMKDGGFNCHSNYTSARHSSVHTTLSIMEGIREYHINGYTYRINELLKAEKDCREFLLKHRLYKSHRTGDVIKKSFTMLSYPPRWFYDILKALDYFQLANASYDNRMGDAIELLLKKRRKDGRWNLQAKHSGKTHFEMERVGQPSRWNTLRALRVLKHFGVVTDN